MSVFTSRVTKVLEIPHDAGQSVTIRKLAPKHLDKAARASQLDSIARLNEIGGPAFVKALREMEATTGKPVEEIVKSARQKDPLLTMDRVELLVAGVTGWSYDVKPSREALEDLDEQTIDFIAREILKLSKPSLFQTEQEAEADRKNV